MNSNRSWSLKIGPACQCLSSCKYTTLEPTDVISPVLLKYAEKWRHRMFEVTANQTETYFAKMPPACSCTGGPEDVKK